MKNYIDSQQHWEDSVNADYDYMEAMKKEQFLILHKSLLQVYNKNKLA